MSQKTILLLHGTADCAANWKPWCLWLENQGYTVIAPDLPGHGLGANPKSDCSVLACCQFLKPLIEEHRPALLIGHSLGGTVVVELVRQGIAIERLLLVCPALAIPEPTKFFYNLFTSEPLNISHDQKTWLRPLFSISPRLVTANSTAPDVIRSAWFSLRDWQAPDWSNFKIPVRMLTGQLDHIAPPGALEAIIKQMPDASLMVAPSSHQPMDQTPVTFKKWLQCSLS
jgi:pimeloyl-ACP methyl ester carboxylesterase